MRFLRKNSAKQGSGATTVRSVDPRGLAAAVRPVAEALEDRRLFAVTLLPGSVLLPGQEVQRTADVNNTDRLDFYKFRVTAGQALDVTVDASPTASSSQTSIYYGIGVVTTYLADGFTPNINAPGSVLVSTEDGRSPLPHQVLQANDDDGNPLEYYAFVERGPGAPGPLPVAYEVNITGRAGLVDPYAAEGLEFPNFRLGTLTQPGFIGPLDDTDLFFFDVPAGNPLDVTVTLNAGSSANRGTAKWGMGRDANGDGVYPLNEDFFNINVTRGATMHQRLEPGTGYFMFIESLDDTAIDYNYTLSVLVQDTRKPDPVDTAGGTPTPLGDFPSVARASDWVGIDADPADYYSFTSTTTATVPVRFSALSTRTTTLPFGATLTVTGPSGTFTTSGVGDVAAGTNIANVPVVANGTYIVRVVPTVGTTDYEDVFYQLDVGTPVVTPTPTPTPTPGGGGGGTTTPVPDPLAPPTAPLGSYVVDLTAQSVSATQVNLAFRDNSAGRTNETGYTVLRSTSAAGPFVAVGSIAPGVTVYSDPGLTPETTYYYQVQAIVAGAAAADTISNAALATTVTPVVVDTSKPPANAAPETVVVNATRNSVIAGDRASVAVRVAGGSPGKRLARFSLYATTASALAGTEVPFAVIEKTVKFGFLGSKAKLDFTYPSNLAAGAYNIFVRTVDSASTNTAGTVGQFPTPVTIAPAFFNLVSGPIVPRGRTFVVGQEARATFSVTNKGNTRFTGDITMALSASADNLISTDDRRVLTSVRTATIRPGFTKVFNVRFLIPSVLAPANYFLTGTATATGDTDLGDNSAVATEVVTVTAL